MQKVNAWRITSLIVCVSNMLSLIACAVFCMLRALKEVPWIVEMMAVIASSFWLLLTSL
jgi:hypothetical protein